MASHPAIHTERVQLIGLITAKEGMSREEFTMRWLKHGELIRSLDYIQANILQYTQYHLDASLPPEYASLMVACSGIAIMEADSLDNILGIFTSEEFLTKVKPDEETFLDREKSRMFPAFAATIINRERTEGA